jgi:tRNA pseudouridine38-40 synthase
VRTLVARYLLKVEYAGTLFYGFQKQPGLSTVQGELEEAVFRITGERVRVMGAGRTDAGVHAIGQAVAFDLCAGIDIQRVQGGLNAVLPPGIAVGEMAAVRGDLDPRRDALWREYRYFILNRKARSPVLADYTHHVTTILDGPLIERACSLMVGVHDFSAFRVKGDKEDHAVREVKECELSRSGAGLLCIRVCANAFLYRMVRIMAGAITAAGSSRMSMDELAAHLEGGVSPCADPLPACGLFLWRVAYPADITVDPRG